MLTRNPQVLETSGRNHTGRIETEVNRVLKTAKKTGFILLAFLIGAAFGNYASVKKTQRDASAGCINAMLYDLDIEVDLLEHWKTNYKNDQISEEKLKHLIFNHLIAMAATKPDISDLEGVPPDALHRLSEFNKDNGFSIKKYDSVFKAATDYLSSIENDVKVISDKRKDNLKNLSERLRLKKK